MHPCIFQYHPETYLGLVALWACTYVDLLMIFLPPYVVYNVRVLSLDSHRNNMVVDRRRGGGVPDHDNVDLQSLDEREVGIASSRVVV